MRTFSKNWFISFLAVASDLHDDWLSSICIFYLETGSAHYWWMMKARGWIALNEGQSCCHRVCSVDALGKAGIWSKKKINAFVPDLIMESNLSGPLWWKRVAGRDVSSRRLSSPSGHTSPSAGGFSGTVSLRCSLTGENIQHCVFTAHLHKPISTHAVRLVVYHCWRCLFTSQQSCCSAIFILQTLKSTSVPG